MGKVDGVNISVFDSVLYQISPGFEEANFPKEYKNIDKVNT